LKDAKEKLTLANNDYRTAYFKGRGAWESKKIFTKVCFTIMVVSI
jgi:hypothetical protein